MAAERRQPLKVEVPSAKDESVRFGRVGIIVSVGFAIGIVWPRLAGVRLAPSVPALPADSSSADLTGAPAEPRASAAAAPPAASTAAEPRPEGDDKAAGSERLVVTEPQFVNCRDKNRKRPERCDHIEFDAIARPHVEALQNCDGADSVEGILSLRLDLDFEDGKIKSFGNGKSTTLPQSDVDNLIGCAKREFENVSLSGIAHENVNYTAFYRIEFRRPPPKRVQAEPGAVDGGEEVVEASGRATVSWDVALVHASVGREGPVVARVLQGTRVTVTGRHGDWYRVKYDAKGSQGWVFRTAIGM